MKSVLNILLVAVLIIGSLTACSDKNDTTDEEKDEPFVPSELSAPVVDWSANEDINVTADLLQEYLTEYYSQLAKYPVRYTGDESYREGDYAVWVEELPEYKPYPNEDDPDYYNVKAVFIYYPLNFDPSALSEEELADAGAVRVFAYIGYPHEKAPGNYPGMVYLHGGGGHASPEYVVEAVKHGFTSVSIDIYGQYIPMSLENASSESHFDDLYSEYVKKDVLCHLSNSSFKDIENPLDQQWLYWTVGDAIIANSVLRAEEHTLSDKVGITGISWGGIVTTTAACYDYRFSFAVPIYNAFHMSESRGNGLGLIENERAVALWQDVDLLKRTPVHILVLAGDSDGFSTVNCNVASFHDCKNGYLIIRPWFTHTGFDAAAVDEPYRFGLYATGLGYGFIEAERQPSSQDGREYDLKINIPDDISDVRVDIFWKEGPITNSDTGWNFKHKDLSFDKQSGIAKVVVPENAYMYYISFRGYDSEIRRIKSEGTPYSYVYNIMTGIGTPSYFGTVFSSTDIVVLGDGNIAE